MSRDLEDLAHAIITWSEERPQWQQQALRMLARQEPIGDKEARSFAESAEREAAGLHVDVKALKTADFLGSENRQPVRLVSITNPQSVNALTWSEGLTFEPHGITVVYGENGSGKSGYARILKKVTRARHSADVLTNVFKPPADQSARLTVSLAFDEVQLNWPSDHPDFLSQVSFYDNECATRYVSADTEVAYRPSAIALLDDLVGLSGSVRCALEARRPTHSDSMQDLPVLPVGSRAYEFVMVLSADTTRLDIDLASELPADAKARLAALHKRITNLESDDLDRKRAALKQLVQSLQDLAAHITQTRETLSDMRIVAIQQARLALINARKAADAASAAQFASEPIKGVGSPSWQILWDAAKRFSVTQAYSGHEYPVLEIEGEPAHCVLCHQKLSDPAAARLRSFQEYVTADTERTARQAQEKFQTLSEGSRTLEIFNTRVELALQQVEAADEAAHSELRSEIQALEDRRRSIVETLDRGLDEIEQLPGVNDSVAAKALSKESRRQLEDLKADDRQGQLTQLQREEAEICGRQILQNSRQAIENRISSLQQAQVIDKAIRLTDTRGITRRAADLTRFHVSDVLKHHFSQETVRLGLDTVRLADAGGGRGNLRHRARLVGAVQNAPLQAVLSEGEQTALGLAGFLTEVESDSTGSAVVFDDPVTSLDHVRRERMARRIVELGGSRQVIIFTHDVAFIVDLKRAAESAAVNIAERWVTKIHSDVGRVSDDGPWDSRIVRERIGDLEQRLAKVRETYKKGNPRDCQENVRSWYQDLRVVWEHALEEVVLGPVQVRGRLEMRPSNLKVFVRFTEEDDQEFQAAFTRAGERGSHDRSSELNRPLPPISELKEDLQTLRTWHKRIRQYAN